MGWSWLCGDRERSTSNRQRRIAIASLAVVVILCVTGAAASAQTIEVTSGERQTLELPGGEAAEETVRWTATVTFERSPDQYELDLDLPLSIAYTPDDGDGELTVFTVIYANDGPLYERELTADGGGLTSEGPMAKDLDTTVLTQGENELVAMHRVERTGEDASNVTLELGPLTVTGSPPVQASVPSPGAAWTALATVLFAPMVARARST